MPVLVDDAAAARRIEAAQRIVITTHARADPDAIGSAAGLTRVLRLRGKEVRGYLHEAYPSRSAFMRTLEPLDVWPAAANSALARTALAEADLLVIVDTCARSQLGAMAEAIEASSLDRLAIDHHHTRDPIVQQARIDPAAASTAQMVLAVCEAGGWPLDRAAAELLFLGMAGDTGWFRFSNADARAFRAAARLIDLGARPNESYERLYLSDPPAKARLVGAVLSGFELRADGRLAVIRLTRRMLADCGATPDLTEDLVNEPQRVGSVVVAAMFVEGAPGEPVRVNLRSKRGVDVAAIAARFGGGGHVRAAGARIAGDVESVAAQVIPVVIEALTSSEAAT